MTKSEAKAIEQRTVRCLQKISGVKVTSGMPWSKMTAELRDEVWAVLKTINDDIEEVHEMARAELGGR